VTAPAERAPRSFWIGLAAGLVPMVWGTWLYLDATPDLRRRIDFGAWLVGADLVHDFVFAPLVVAVGWAAARVVPARDRPPVTVGLVLTGTVLLVGCLPLIGSATVSNDTIQPRPYGREITTLLVVIWVAALLAVAARRRRSVA
jgi:hypothetical protein